MTISYSNMFKWMSITISLVIFGLSVWVFHLNTKKQSHIYPNLEKLLAIYSLTNWKHPEQQSPHIQTQGDHFDEAGELVDCNSADFNDSSSFYPGALFDCFMETKNVYIAVDDISVEAPNVPPNPDFWSTFKWKSLFGYDYGIDINYDPTPYDNLINIAHSDLQSDCYDNNSEEFHTDGYLITIKGLTASEAGSVTFMAVPSYTTCNADGSTIQRNEWAWILEDEEILYTSDLERLVRITARKLNANGNDLFAAANDLETKWLNKDEEFAKGLMKVLSDVPDLGELSNLLNKTVND